VTELVSAVRGASITERDALESRLFESLHQFRAALASGDVTAYTGPRPLSRPAQRLDDPPGWPCGALTGACAERLMRCLRN